MVLVAVLIAVLAATAIQPLSMRLAAFVTEHIAAHSACGGTRANEVDGTHVLPVSRGLRAPIEGDCTASPATPNLEGPAMMWTSRVPLELPADGDSS